MVLFHDNKSSWFIGLKQDLKKKIMEGESYINWRDNKLDKKKISVRYVGGDIRFDEL